MLGEAMINNNYYSANPEIFATYAAEESYNPSNIKYTISENGRVAITKFREKVEKIVSKLDNIDVSQDQGFIEEHKLLCRNLIADASADSRAFDRAFAELQREFYDRIYAKEFITVRRELAKLFQQTEEYGIAKQEMDETIEGVMVKHYAKKEAAKANYYISELAETADMDVFLSRLRKNSISNY